MNSAFRLAPDRNGGSAAYDPRYDPLVDAVPGHGRAYAPTYWVATAGPPPADDGPIESDVQVDVAVIGAGFTGLATALFLAEEHGLEVAVVEANRTAWGCTSRNGGQGQNASGRLYRSQWIQKWGLDVAKRLDAEIRSGFDTFKSLVTQIDCDAQQGGHLLVAHRPRKMEFLRREAEVLRDVFGYQVELLSAEQLRERYCDEREAAGALHEPDGIGVHPLKLAYGYQRLARAVGARVHSASPVIGWTQDGARERLHTPGGTVSARAVAICTGGYTSQQLAPMLRSRVMPILSNSMVTRPLTDDELRQTNFRSTVFLTDTRTLRFYYRLLPDRRVQIGSRSAITGADAENPRHVELLRRGLARKFPPLAEIDIDYCWWGWVDVSHDMMPRIFQPDEQRRVYYALGYGGNGVAYSAHAGRRLAARIAGQKLIEFDLPIYDSALPRHWAAPLRRVGQAFLYRWYAFRDEAP